MRIGVISDTHIINKETKLDKKILEEFKDVDMIIHSGDLGDLNVLEQLKKVCPDVKAVWGNMDSPEIRHALPEKDIVQAGKYRIGIIHGHGAAGNIVDTVSDSFKNDKVDVIIFGHSHNSLNLKKDGILFFNPGSPTDKVFAATNTFGIIEVNDKIEARIIKL